MGLKDRLKNYIYKAGLLTLIGLPIGGVGGGVAVGIRDYHEIEQDHRIEQDDKAFLEVLTVSAGAYLGFLGGFIMSGCLGYLMSKGPEGPGHYENRPYYLYPHSYHPIENWEWVPDDTSKTN